MLLGNSQYRSLPKEIPSLEVPVYMIYIYSNKSNRIMYIYPHIYINYKVNQCLRKHIIPVHYIMCRIMCFLKQGAPGWTRSREFWMAHFFGAPKLVGLENWSYVMLT